MKKVFPYVIGAAVIVLLFVLMKVSSGSSFRQFDNRITLRRSDKIPYGTHVARDLLPSLFAAANIRNENAAPGKWDSVYATSYKQAVVFVADYFDADKDELEAIANFVERGNYVFIISRAASDDVASFFGISFNSEGAANFYAAVSDSLRLKLDGPGFDSNRLFVYPGMRYDGVLHPLDSTRTVVLGRNEKGFADFVQLNKGSGSVFLHSAPLAFSNYFILHKNNASYYAQALSVLPRDLQTIVWDEYYLQKGSSNKQPNWLSALFSYPSFKWGVLIGAATLTLFVLLGMRRRQRMIPMHQKPKNDSLDFVKTLGRLYYDRRDHKNLAAKMTAYFLEHIRSRYKLPTHTLDEDFMQALHFKSGFPLEETRQLVGLVQYIGSVNSIPEAELAQFHRQLEAFYQNTQHGRTANI